ncbi:hypothetical protein RvY_01843 [Ramazzottius varieornatus]|uniref:Uncharacterized protein n=1 Tax=Ramazzottius varieornatus TaxID=947166 RepID=A0A1D1UPT1_RAMVA|nr:hypothetical protein RvY_01843 [Ramazzottius varieornatus]
MYTSFADPSTTSQPATSALAYHPVTYIPAAGGTPSMDLDQIPTQSPINPTRIKRQHDEISNPGDADDYNDDAYSNMGNMSLGSPVQLTFGEANNTQGIFSSIENGNGKHNKSDQEFPFNVGSSPRTQPEVSREFFRQPFSTTRSTPNTSLKLGEEAKAFSLVSWIV